MKAVILAGGRGSRMEEMTADTNKCLLQINGKTLLEYALDNAIAAGADTLIVVVGYKEDQVIQEIGDGYKDHKIWFVSQRYPGAIGALLSVVDAGFLNSEEQEPFLLLLGDEYYVNPTHIGFSLERRSTSYVGYKCEADRERIKKTYVLYTEGETGRVVRLIEKPEAVRGTYMGTGTWLLKPHFLKYLKQPEQSIPDWLQVGVDHGLNLYPYWICSKYFNINTQEDYLEACKATRAQNEVSDSE